MIASRIFRPWLVRIVVRGDHMIAANRGYAISARNDPWSTNEDTECDLPQLTADYSIRIRKSWTARVDECSQELRHENT